MQPLGGMRVGGMQEQEPDRADERDKPKQQPPAGFVTVVEALDMDDDRGDQGE